MGFKSVYKALQEVFPEVDTRMLKAVALEHSKDADAAVESVLLEVLPFMSKQSMDPGSSIGNQGSRGLKDGRVEFQERRASFGNRLIVEGTTAGPLKSGSAATEDVSIAVHTKCATRGDSSLLDEHSGGSSRSNSNDANDNHDPVWENTGSEDLQVCRGIYAKTGPVQTLESSSIALVQESRGITASLNDLHTNSVKISETVTDWKVGCKPESGPTQFPLDSSAALLQEGSNSVGSLNDHSHADLENSSEGVANGYSTSDMADADEGGVELEFHSTTSITDTEKEQLTAAVDTSSREDDTAGEMVHLGDGASLSTTLTGSGQVCRTDLLEDIIEDAKSNKKTLFSAVESVINFMREVEHQEKAAEEAREEASRGGCDILSRVEEMKKMLQHAKEANDLHSGEVYGEKAILTTEARELQARLLSLSEERDKSLAILDEMRQTLEARLAAAEEEKKAAEQEKMEKENLARCALAEQELIMERVVKESKILQQEAEENSKLQEFLMDRGRLVDTLQGEISVICQDVKLLKEKFDERVPLSHSVSSSQTSCILASSSTSLKSTMSDRVAGQNEPIETPKNRSPTPSIGSATPKSRSGDDGARGYDKALLDDGWDLFNDDDDCFE